MTQMGQYRNRRAVVSSRRARRRIQHEVGTPGASGSILALESPIRHQTRTGWQPSPARHRTSVFAETMEPDRPDPEELTDDELERELTLAVTATDIKRLDYYELLLREKAERRTRRVDDPEGRGPADSGS